MTANTLLAVSVIIASRNEENRLAATVTNICRSIPPNGQIVVIDDASTDGSADTVHRLDPRIVVCRAPRRLGVARARNLGARLSAGEVLVFCDAHVRTPDVWLGPLCDALKIPGVGAVGPALVDGEEPAFRGYGLVFADLGTNLAWLARMEDGPHPVPLLPGFFLAVRRPVFERIGGFDAGMRGWGMEDNEFSLHLWTRGLTCLLVPDVEVVHLSTTPDYHNDWAAGLHNILRLGITHFTGQRLRGMLEYYAQDPTLASALASVLDSGTVRRQQHLQAVRCRDDAWYFSTWPLAKADGSAERNGQ
jgi:glycosyltransferase involved in cell wall biosynthesis